MKKLLAATFLLFAFSSCISTKWHHNYPYALHLENDLQHFNGVYDNAPLKIEKNDPYSYPMYALLFKTDKIYTWDEIRDYSGKIKMEVVSDKKIKVSYLIDDLIVAEKMIKGKLTGNIFSAKRQIRFLVLVLVNFYGEVKLSIYLNEKGELVVRKERFGWGNILILSGGSTDGGTNTGGRYARISEK
jgi:hypothetical protein